MRDYVNPALIDSIGSRIENIVWHLNTNVIKEGKYRSYAEPYGEIQRVNQSLNNILNDMERILDTEYSSRGLYRLK